MYNNIISGQLWLKTNVCRPYYPMHLTQFREPPPRERAFCAYPARSGRIVYHRRPTGRNIRICNNRRNDFHIIIILFEYRYNYYTYSCTRVTSISH